MGGTGSIWEAGFMMTPGTLLLLDRDHGLHVIPASGIAAKDFDEN